MTYIKFQPMPDFENLTEQFQRIFKEKTNGDSQTVNSFIPKIDISEDEKNFYIDVELPGINKSGLKIKLENNLLTISGEKKLSDEKIKNRKFRSSERIFGTFNKNFTMNAEINRDTINAEFENGVLTLRIEKLIPEKKEREIEIK